MKNIRLAICIMQFAILLSVFFLPATAFAHGIEVFAKVKGKTIQGTAQYHGGTPVQNGEVKAYDSSGNELDRTKTDTDGKFTLEARFHCEYRLLVDTNDGHGGEYTISEKLLPGDLPEPAKNNSEAAAHSHDDEDHHAKHPHADSETADTKHQTVLLEDMHGDVDAIQEQLDQLKNQREFRDILGGIGFIIGIAGGAYGFYYRGLMKSKK